MNSLSDLIFHQNNIYSNSIALDDENQKINYNILNKEAIKIASCLKQNASIGQTFGIIGQRKISVYYSILGVIYSGSSFTPLLLNFKKQKLLSIIKQSNIKYVIGEYEDILLFKEMVANSVDLKFIITSKKFDRNSNKNFIFVRDTNKFIDKPIPTDKNDLVYIMFTSGSTGDPKGVKISNKNILSFLDSMSKLYPIKSKIIASQTFDLSFDPSISDIFFTWKIGGTLCILNEKEKLLPYQYILRNKINFWNSVPTIINFMNKMGILKPNIFPSIQYSMFCGEPLPKELAEAWKIAAPNSTIENLYGPTEATIYITRNKYESRENDSFYNSIIPIGKVFPSHKIAIINKQNNKINNGIGELCFSGEQISEGYLNNQLTTEANFIKFKWDKSDNIWYKTGDLGFINDYGEIECIGRSDLQIKIGGKRIELSEVEHILSKNNEIDDVVVVAIKNAQNHVESLIAFSEKKINKINERIFLEKFEQYLDKSFFPKVFYQIEKIPYTESLKIDRKKLESIAYNKYKTSKNA